MFGDEPIVLHQFNAIDQKNRIIVPASTKVEKQERLIIGINEFNIVELYSAKKEIENILLLKKKYEEEGNIEGLKNINDLIYKKFANMYGMGEVDNQGRITIPKFITEKFGYSNRVLLHGFYDQICIFADEESFELHNQNIDKIKIKSLQK